MRIRALTLALVAVIAMAVLHARGVQQDDPSEKPAASRQRNVLFLSPDDFTRPYVRLMFEGFSDVLNDGPDPPAIYFETPRCRSVCPGRTDRPKPCIQIQSAIVLARGRPYSGTKGPHRPIF